MRRQWLYTTALSLFAGMLAFAPLGPARAADPGEHFVAKTPLTIGYSIYDLKQPYFQLYLKGVQDGAKQVGFTKVLISNEQSNERLMVSGSEALISQGISALVISPEQPSALPQIEAAAKRAHIPVIIGDVGTAGDYWQVFVESNNAGGGAQAAQYLLEQLKDKPAPHEVAIIALRPTTSVRGPRTDGFVDALKGHKDFKIVATLDGKETVPGGYAAMAALLASHPKLQGVYCENDPEAEGASRQLVQARKDPMTDPVLVGFNGDPPALTLVQRKELAADVAQDPYTEGVAAAHAAFALLHGQKVAYTNEAKKEIQIPTALVTLSNVDQFINRHK
ncbi:MAG: substrate-binding domain-containing protein [Acetobacteraceae bacterium]